ncbi:MAG: hypothetical protein WBI05_10070, partial [Rhodoferax sp.]|uniref:hypothetical protein n=1 Tax=Rhodoferax sp. TaxID=50421 RepID=UPI003C7761FA
DSNVPSSGADLCDERRQSARSGALALSGAPDSTVVELKGYPIIENSIVLIEIGLNSENSLTSSFTS